MDKAQVLARLTRAVASEDRTQALPLRLCVAGVALVGADGGAITLAYTRPQRLTVCVTSDVAARLEDLQDVLGEGPGPQAFQSARMVTSRPVTDDAGPWPVFAKAALAAVGSAAIYAVPMSSAGGVIGVLTFYQIPPRALGESEEVARFVADSIGAALLSDQGMRSVDDVGTWASRAMVHQATGMVMAQLGISAPDALAVLRAHAFADDTTLEEIAESVADLRFDFSRDMGRGDQP